MPFFDEHGGRLSRRRYEHRFRARFEMQDLLHYVIDEKSLARARIAGQDKNAVVGV